MRSDFAFLNLHPAIFDAERLPLGQECVGHVFDVEEIEGVDGRASLAFVVKVVEPTKAVDPTSGVTVDVGRDFAVRVPATAALQRLRTLLLEPDGSPVALIPLLLFVVAITPTGRRYVAAARPRAGHSMDTPRTTFQLPQAAAASTPITVVEEHSPPPTIVAPQLAPVSAPQP